LHYQEKASPKDGRMRDRKWTRLLAAAGACVMLASPALAEPWHVQSGWPAGARRIGSDERPGRHGSRGYHEPAFARGYEDGYSRGAADGRGRNRYDPVRDKDYRNGDAGYSAAYGSREAYRNNYRAGFREGYENGYRDSTR
jgi:hypothetical protein